MVPGQGTHHRPLVTLPSKLTRLLERVELELTRADLVVDAVVVLVTIASEALDSASDLMSLASQPAISSVLSG